MDATVFVENLTEEQQEPLKKERRGRKPKEVINEDAQAMDLVAAKAKEAELSTAEVDKAYLPEGETYNLHITMKRARFYQAQAANSLIELGKQLLLLKHHEPHGQFIVAVEELGLAYRSAAYAMTAAQKFSNVPLVAHLGRTKLKVLSVLDDEQIAQMKETGTLAGVGTVDEIKKMSRKDLEAALREEKKKRKEEREAQEAAISQKEKKLNELEMQLRYREPPTKEELAQAELDEKRKPLFTAIMSGIEDLSVATDRILDICRIDNIQIDQLTRLARSFDSEMSLLKERLDELDETLNAACPIKEDVPCMSNTQSK